MPTPKLHGYDFSHQGLLGVWEGFPPSSHVQTPPEATPRGALLELPSTPRGLAAELGAHSQHRPLSPSDEIHGDFHSAVVSLCSRGGERTTWKPTVSTQKLAQRQFALQLCGWSLKEDDLNNAIKRSQLLFHNNVVYVTEAVQMGKGRQALPGSLLASLYQTI